MPVGRALLMIGASLLLAGCAATTTPATVARLNGTPSLSIAVPLVQAGCTADGSCIALGAQASVVPSSVGQYRLANGRWVALALPSTMGVSITSVACWSDACLIGGSQPGSNLLWRYDAADHSVVPVPSPAHGRGVEALSCFADDSCALVDSTGPVTASRLSFSSDGGETWISTTVPWTSGHPVTALACLDDLDCLLAATSGGGAASLEVTHDGGATWTALNVPAGWTTLSSLTCAARHCAALATTSSATSVVRSSRFGSTWSGVAVDARVRALACATLSHCLLAGETTDGRAWLARLTRSRVTPLRLRYVPTPLVSVACAPAACVAVGSTTVLATRS